MTTEERLEKLEKELARAKRRSRVMLVAAVMTVAAVFLLGAGCAKAKVAKVEIVAYTFNPGFGCYNEVMWMHPSCSGTVSNASDEKIAFNVTVHAIFSNSSETFSDLVDKVNLQPGVIGNFWIVGDSTQAYVLFEGATLSRLWVTFD